MSELSTRIWLDEGLWGRVRTRAVAQGTTIRELLPRLVEQAVAEAPRAAARPAPLAPPVPSPPPTLSPPPPIEPEDTGPPVVVLAEAYRCATCGAAIRLSGLSNHLGKHLKEQQAQQTEGS